MRQAVAIFVSKRPRRPAAALTCLILAQLLPVMANCDGEPAAMAARLAAEAR
jgi:hypothetical protein